MKRNELTTAERLKIGDRFYKLADKQKKVFEKVDCDVKTTQYRTYKHFCIEASILESSTHWSHKKRYVVGISSDTQVVYLRSNSNQ